MMSYKAKEASGTPVKDKECIHYWVIESATGPISRGVCKFCGAQKEFYNSWPEFTYMSRDTRVVELPESLDIEPDSERGDSKLEESSVSL